MNRREALKKMSLGTSLIISAPVLINIFSSCGGTQKTTEKVLFSSKQLGTLYKLCNVIIPTDDKGPSAGEAGCVSYINSMLEHVLPEKYVVFFKHCFNTFEKTYSSSTEQELEQTVAKLFSIPKEEQEKILKKVQNNENDASQIDENIKSYAFLLNLKNLAVSAYFVNKKVGETILNYDPIPGVYLGCISAEEVGNRWSL